VTALGRALARIAEALYRHNVDFAVVGGLAVSVRAEPRMTRDADVAVLVGSDDDAEALLYRLMSDGFVVDTAIEQISTGRLATARLRHPESGSLVTDLLFASSGIEPEVVASAPTGLSPLTLFSSSNSAAITATVTCRPPWKTSPERRVRAGRVTAN